MKIGDKIRTLRELKGFSQEFMAEKLNLSVNSYGRLERGETQVTLNRLEEVAGILEIGIEELLKLDGYSFTFHSHNNQTVVNNAIQNGPLTFGEKEVYEMQPEAMRTEIANLKRIIELLEEQIKR